MPTLVERIAAGYAPPEGLGGVTAAPSPYVACRPSPAPIPPTPAAVHAAAERDATRPLTTMTQRMAATYGGPSSRTIPQAGAGFAEYRRKAQEMGVDEASARKCLDAFLAVGDEPR